MVKCGAPRSFQTLQSGLFSVVITALVVLNCPEVDAQGSFFEFGICACTPSSYDFRLDFTQGCPTKEAIELILEPGIESAECAVVPTNSSINVSDLMPISIHSISVQELKQDNTVSVSQTVEGDFREGDAFR